MIGNTFVMDAVVHPWNLGPENQDPRALDVLEAVYGSHRLALDEAHADYMLQRDEPKGGLRSRSSHQSECSGPRKPIRVSDSCVRSFKRSNTRTK